MKATKRELAYAAGNFGEVHHTTLDPEGPGVVRIHLVPPLVRDGEIGASVAILNGQDIIPVNTSWSILLTEFIRSVNEYSGRPVTDEDVGHILETTCERVKKVYPDKHLRPAKFASYKFWNVIPTMIESLVVIILAYIAQRWIFVDVYVPASYIATGVIAAGQVVSICENKCSCRLPNDRHYRIWKALAKVFIDKTERHFDTDLSDLKKILNEEKEDEK